MQNKRALRILKWAAIIAVGILLFLWGERAAYIERGYEAVGGEYLLLLFPFFWWAIERSIKDFRQMRRGAEQVAEDERGDEDGTGEAR